MATQIGSIASSIVGIRPRFYDKYAIHFENATPGLSDIMQNVTTGGRITEEDILRKIVYVIDWKLVKNVSSDLLGSLMSQSFTNEHSDSLNTFEFKYVVDRTGPARETGYNTGAPIVTLEVVTRTVKLTNPRAVNITVPKHIYRRMQTALEEISGISDATRSIKPYLGENGELKMTPLWHSQVKNYIAAIKTRADVALNSQNQGTNESQLEFLFTRAPDLRLSPIKDAFIAHTEFKLVIPSMIMSFMHYMFFVNKIMGCHLKKPNLTSAMSQLFRAYLLNTSENLMPELEPTFENLPFKRATGILTCTNNVRNQLASMGLISHGANAVMIKKISYCHVGPEDLHPFDNYAPHKMVQQVDHGMFKQTETGSLKTVNQRVEAPIEYITAPEGNFVINVVTEAHFGNKNSLPKIGMRQITAYDEMIPVGFIIESGNHGDEDKLLKPAPQKSYYTDHNGITKCLTVSQIAEWIANLQEFYKNSFGALLSQGETGIDNSACIFGTYDGTNYIHNQYAFQNKYMYNEIIISNVLTYIQSNTGDIIDPRPPSKDDEKNPNIPNRLKQSKFFHQFVSDIGRHIDNSYKLLLKLADYIHEQHKIPYMQATDALVNVFFIENDRVGGHMREWNFNPGIAVVMVREVTCETDSILLSRPGGAHLITAPHELEKLGDLSDKTSDISFHMKQQHGHSICGLGNTSVKLCGAFNVQRIGSDTVKSVNPLNRELAQSLEFSSNDQSPNKNPEWWPVLWDPKVAPGFFDGACSPTGRNPGPFDSAKDFNTNFWKKEQNDVQFPDLGYSINSMFKFDTNELLKKCINGMGYLPGILSNRKCPLYKYLNFSSDRRSDISEAQNHQLRLAQIQGGGIAPDGSELDMTMPTYSYVKNMSVTCGAAVVKRCYTHEGLINLENQNRLPSIYKGSHVIKDPKYGHNYFYPGSGAFEIFDIGVAHSFVS